MVLERVILKKIINSNHQHGVSTLLYVGYQWVPFLIRHIIFLTTSISLETRVSISMSSLYNSTTSNALHIGWNSHHSIHSHKTWIVRSEAFIDYFGSDRETFKNQRQPKLDTHYQCLHYLIYLSITLVIRAQFLVWT